MVLGERGEHERGSLRMAHVVKFFESSSFAHVADHGWQVILTQLVKTEIVVFFLVNARVKFYVLLTVRCAAIVSNPDIESSLRQPVDQGILLCYHEKYAITEEAMLHQYGPLARLSFRFGPNAI